MSDLVKNIIRLLIFTLAQVYVLNAIPHLHRFVTPYLYFLFILWLPFSIPRLGMLALGFLCGILLDYFTMTPGLHTAACVLVAYARPFIIYILIAKETTEFNFHEPSPHGMGWAPYMVYVLILTFMHHTYMIILEWMQFRTVFWQLLVKILATTAISMLLIFTVELLFPRRLRYRTNAA